MITDTEFDYLNNRLDYDATTGLLYWNDNAYRWAKGKEAGNKNSRYTMIGFTSPDTHKDRFELANRLIWRMCKGKIPDNLYIDHINGDKKDNRIENLRLATNQQNMQNTGIWKTNTTGVRNVKQLTSGNWQVNITINKKKYCFGTYEDIELAELVAEEARDKYFNEFNRSMNNV